RRSLDAATAAEPRVRRLREAWDRLARTLQANMGESRPAPSSTEMGSGGVRSTGRVAPSLGPVCLRSRDAPTAKGAGSGAATTTVPRAHASSWNGSYGHLGVPAVLR